jgi:hypothetical protein
MSPATSPMEEVLREICVLQYGLSEEEASLIEEIQDLDDTHGSDWYQSESADDNFQEYLRLQDLAEMNKDMEEWEYNEATHEYFANGGSVKVSLPVVFTNMGEKYSQGISEYGKVFIPNVALNYFRTYRSNWCQLEFKGFEEARRDEVTGRMRVTLPWRCLRVE